MLIIPIDNFRKKNGIQGNINPILSMKEKGSIHLNVTAAKLLKLKDGAISYMHFYQDGDDLFIKVDNEPTHGVRMIYKEKAASCSCYGRNTTQYFIKEYAPDQKQISFNITDSDFGKFKITPLPF